MKLRLFFILPAVLFCLSGPLYGRTIRVALIPLTFHSREDLSALRQPLLNMLLKSLRQQGFYPLSAAEEVAALAPAAAGRMHDDLARQIGDQLGCSFVIYGSLSKIGEQISLDVRLVDVSKRRATVPIYATQTGLENLASAVATLAREVGIRIYRKKKIHRILVAGNQRIEDEAIKLVIKSRSGDIFELARLRQDLKAIYRMGYFKDVRIEAEDTPQGEDVTFVVSEKPTIGKVSIRGARVIDEKDIRAALSTKVYSILQRSTLNADLEKIRSLYRDKGYYKAEASYKLEPLEKNRVAVIFQIKEHRRVYIHRITFSGNRHYSDRKLKHVIKTSTKGLFFWLTDSGILKREKLEVDVDRLATFYHNHGFIDAQVGSPTIGYDEEGITIDFPISEGERFRVGKVTVAGKDVKPEPKLLAALRLPKEEYFNRKALVRDLQKVADYYTSQGYAFAEVAPKLHKKVPAHAVDVVYEVSKGKLVNFGRITISGNDKTRDKVIRRELEVVEGARYNKAELQKSVQNLRRLDFFEKVDLETSKGTKPYTMDLNVKVKEKPTRFMSFGGGYSSADKAFLMAQVAERNLGGRGQNLQFQGEYGGVATRFSLRFTEPWLFDIPLSASVEAHDWFRDYDEYDKESRGGKLGFGYPIWDYTRIYVSYGFDHSTVKNLAPNVSKFIKEQEGTIISSVLSTTLRRDSRDRLFLTTRGSDNSIQIDYAGGLLGGDATYAKLIANSGWYFPLFWKFVGFVHGKLGFLTRLGGGIAPIYERFFLGGINSIRAFAPDDVSPRDPKTGDRIGGNKMALFNTELLFPLVEQQGLRGVVFFDAGNAFDNGESLDITRLRTAAGGGIRWQSPMGPLRLEWGYNLDPKPGEAKSKWQFSMGVFF